jgi:hypothetical protein
MMCCQQAKDWSGKRASATPIGSGALSTLTKVLHAPRGALPHLGFRVWGVGFRVQALLRIYCCFAAGL